MEVSQDRLDGSTTVVTERISDLEIMANVSKVRLIETVVRSVIEKFADHYFKLLLPKMEHLVQEAIRESHKESV